MIAVSIQDSAVDVSLKIIFWALTPCKTIVRRMLQHPPEPHFVILKTEAASFFETLEEIFILNGVKSHKKHLLR
jgi:hypothetical protein